MITELYRNMGYFFGIWNSLDSFTFDGIFNGNFAQHLCGS